MLNIYFGIQKIKSFFHNLILTDRPIGKSIVHGSCRIGCGPICVGSDGKSLISGILN